jgi:hypothetical protein
MGGRVAPPGATALSNGSPPWEILRFPWNSDRVASSWDQARCLVESGAKGETREFGASAAPWVAHFHVSSLTISPQNRFPRR